MTFQKSNFYKTRVYICFCQKKLRRYFFVMLKGLKASNIVLLLIHYLCTKETKKILLILLVLKIVFSNKYFSRNFFNHPTIRFCIFNAFTSHCNKMFQSIKYRFSSCWARRRTAKIITIVGLFVCIWKMIRSLVI